MREQDSFTESDVLHSSSKALLCEIETLLKREYDVSSSSEVLGVELEDASPLASGILNTKYILSAGGETFVLKLYTDRLSYRPEWLSSESRAQAEYNGLVICQQSGLGAPAPVALGRKSIVMSFVRGVDLFDNQIREESVADALSWLLTLHSIPVPKNTPGLSVVNGAIRSTEARLRSAARHGESVQRAKTLLSQIKSRKADLSNVRALTHGDPNLSNWKTDGTKVFAVDLEFFGIGHPVLDAGLFVGSILHRRMFDEKARELCCLVLRRYLRAIPAISLDDLELGVMCGLILIATTLPDPLGTGDILTRIQDVLLSIKEVLAR